MPDKNLVSICPFETDESAVCSLPLRLTLSGILFAVLLLISSVSVYDFLDGVKEKEALDEVSKLTVAAEQLSLRGRGSEVAMEFNLPEKVAADFGTLPGRQGNWPADASNYCIRFGKKTGFYSSAAFFSNPGFNGPVSFGSGMHRLLLSTKIESKSGKLFVVISEKEQ
jgi:hypothetical protein